MNPIKGTACLGVIKHIASRLPVRKMKLAEGRRSVFILQMDTLIYLSHSKNYKMFHTAFKANSTKKKKNYQISQAQGPQ